MSNSFFRVNGSKYLLEIESDDSTVTIWDTDLEDALVDYPNGSDPLAPRPPSPIVATGLTEGEAFSWLMEALGLDRPFIPVTRV